MTFAGHANCREGRPPEKALTPDFGSNRGASWDKPCRQYYLQSRPDGTIWH